MKNVGTDLEDIKTRGDFRQLAASSNADGELVLSPNHPVWELWDRMTEFYGAAFVSQYGEEPTLTWAEMLKELSPEQFAHGFSRLKDRDSAFPPNPGEFLALCRQGDGGYAYSGEAACHKIYEPDRRLEDITAKEKSHEAGKKFFEDMRGAF